jgi:hypothetical protein
MQALQCKYKQTIAENAHLSGSVRSGPNVSVKKKRYLDGHCRAVMRGIAGHQVAVNRKTRNSRMVERKSYILQKKQHAKIF